MVDQAKNLAGAKNNNGWCTPYTVYYYLAACVDASYDRSVHHIRSLRHVLLNLRNIDVGEEKKTATG